MIEPADSISVGDRVRVVALDDEFGDASLVGRVGVTTHRIMDHGATARDPMFSVRFADGSEDAFFATELAPMMHARPDLANERRAE